MQSMQSVHRLLAIIGLLLVILSVGCAGSSSPAVSPPQLVFSLSGSGDSLLGSSTIDTKVFHISKGEWYIQTTCEALKAASPVFLAASVFPKDKPVDNTSFVAIDSQNTPGTAATYVHQAGDFYLSIVAMNVKSWSVKVYQ